LIKNVIFDCVELHEKFKKNNMTDTDNAYIIFDDYDHKINPKIKSENNSKKTSKKTSKNK